MFEEKKGAGGRPNALVEGGKSTQSYFCEACPAKVKSFHLKNHFLSNNFILETNKITSNFFLPILFLITNQLLTELCLVSYIHDSHFHSLGNTASLQKADSFLAEWAIIVCSLCSPNRISNFSDLYTHRTDTLAPENHENQNYHTLSYGLHSSHLIYQSP